MRELKYLFLIVFIFIPTSLFLKSDNIKEGFSQALFVAGVIALITSVFFSIYLTVQSGIDKGVLQ